MLKKSAIIHHREAGEAVARSSLILIVCLHLFCFAQLAHAAVVWSGDVDPADPTTWTSSTDGYIGKTGSGTLDITDGSDVLDDDGFIGYNSGSTGEVTVGGADSTWTNTYNLVIGTSGNGTLSITGGGTVNNTYGQIGFFSGSTGEVTVDGIGSTWASSYMLYVGSEGNGTLNITGGGEVTGGWTTWVSRYPSSTGSIHFDNGTLTTGGFISASDDLTGTGTINTGGLVSDVDLVFDATHGLSQTLTINDNPGQNITVNLTTDGSGAMGAGYGGMGTMSISDGIIIESSYSYIGYKSGSVGEVTVDGVGSTWTSSGSLVVGIDGSGTLNITGGGEVSNSYGYIGSGSGSTGEVTVDGVGSTWMNNTELYVGNFGNGTLNITDGGKVSNGHPSRIGHESGSTGEVTVDGVGSTWTSQGILVVGWFGSGSMNITGGGTLVSGISIEGTLPNIIGFMAGSTGEVTVDGAGSTWTCNKNLAVGGNGSGMLNITNGGLVSVADMLATDGDEDGNSFISMSTGGMLALQGDADGSLAEFLDLVLGTDTIRYWDDSVSDWADIAGATYGRDYTLSYLVGGALDGYTMLTVERATDGDANGDGMVNDADAAVLGTYWQTASVAGWEMGDFNGDGAVNDLDATILAANWESGDTPGDANGDGLVNDADAAVLGRYWQTASGATWRLGDFNGDGAVNDIDATLLAANWTSSANAAVPEPTGVVLLWAVVAAGIGFSSRRRKG